MTTINLQKTTPRQFSKRAVEALRTLRAGGEYRYALERDFRGIEQFHARLVGPSQRVVPGFGGVTFRELEAAGKLRISRSYSGCTYFVARS